MLRATPIFIELPRRRVFSETQKWLGGVTSSTPLIWRTVDESPIAIFRSAIYPLKVPAAVRVYEDAVEVTQLGLGGRNTQRMLYQHIAQVTVRQSLYRTTLMIEGSRGDTMLVENMTRKDAESARDLIRERTDLARSSSSVGAASAPVSDIPAQIRELARLREEGIITEAEFETKKKDLLDRL
jgi:hypothetical protein